MRHGEWGKDPQPEPQERHQKYCKAWKKKNSTCQEKKRKKQNKPNSYKIEEPNKLTHNPETLRITE